ncbi:MULTISPECIES: hypothetical protein [unclassified Halorubrum]|uniref:hypothetical protein n=1 Tax=unclassified Halorubrum TaxID=2642239 RepID=UPI00190DF280|nr:MULTISPECIES: hypothetical protein [unclassified Halorubrum]
MRAKHYCADCGWHFRVDPAVHADLEHDGGLFRGVVNGNFRDYERRQRFRV